MILYALLCGTLPFDDENIPILFKKIKSGMYGLPSHLTAQSRELILKMLVVDPIKRITISDVRQHPWYQHKLPAYLTLPPASIERQERYIDNDIVEKVCLLPIRGLTAEMVRAAIDPALQTPQNKIQHDLRVAYELLLDEKRHKLRIEDVMLALQDVSSTPPALGSSPRILGMSPLSTSRGGDSAARAAVSSSSSAAASENRPLAPTVADTRDLASRRRRLVLQYAINNRAHY